MPMRSSTSRVLRWPDRQQIDVAVRAWAEEARRRLPALLCLGYFGSYARGDWGVGSDLDLVAVVSLVDEPFERRGLALDTTALPVPVELLVYTADEWSAMQRAGGRFARTLAGQTVWVLGEPPPVQPSPTP